MRCFICSAPATVTVSVPATGWGSEYPKAGKIQAPACEAHAAGPANEAELVAAFIRQGNKKAARPEPGLRAELEAEALRMALATFSQVYDKPWGRVPVIVSHGLGVLPEAKPLIQELDADLKEAIREFFPEPGPHAKIDYHFFEVESEVEEDSVLWLRLPGGLVIYAFPGEL